MTITEFILARVAEDEAAARMAPAGSPRWFATSDGFDEVYAVVEIGEYVATFTDSSREELAAAAHIARHDPARVLAECEAKRRIVEAAAVFDDQYEGGGLRIALAHIAAIWADHADYQPEWKVEQ